MDEHKLKRAASHDSTDSKDSLPNNVGQNHLHTELILDPAHQKVNPNTVSEIEFQQNSRYYGRGVPSGGVSTWDAVRPPSSGDASSIDTVDDMQHKHRDLHSTTPGSVSINNILGTEINQLYSANSPEKGKRRGSDPKEPASRTDHHIPRAKEKIVGKLKVLYAKAINNQDILSSGEAMEEGHMEKGCK
jgi:hypothetical protein